MSSTRNVIGGRLRLKGHAGILKKARRKKKKKEAAVAENHEEVKAAMGTKDHDGNEQQNMNDAKEASHEDNVPLNEQSSVPLTQDAVSGGNEPTEAQEHVKTEAEKRFEEMQLRREKERLRKQAATSYRQNLEKFNDRLAKEPEHFDLFKVSHTK